MSFAMATGVNAKDDQWQQNVPIKFLKLLMEQQPLCESGSDYENCENYISSITGKRYLLFQWNKSLITLVLIVGYIVIFNKKNIELYFSRIPNDVYEYNSEETNIEKLVNDLSIGEEKRDHSRAGCDCQLSVSWFVENKSLENLLKKST